ncbi:early nodulin-like protein 9 [Bidens hawaiensis]|uniref:early nodulin-like protein 9 n=1 Tax=Bidens hawaiensis TaxID=980011 RepID=UPI004049C719
MKRPMLTLQGLFSLFLIIQNVHAYQFKVGGSGDWSLASSSSYDQWAHKSRFQIGDTLLFNYKANGDSVLQVTEADYKNCSSASPIAKYTDGHTLITLNQSGPHYFISGVVDHCKNKEKLVIVVLADRSNHTTSNPPSSSPPSEQFASPPPAPSAPEPDLNPAPAPAPAHSDDNPPPSPTPNGASSMVGNFFSFFGAFVGFVIFSF